VDTDDSGTVLILVVLALLGGALLAFGLSYLHQGGLW
jgi:hypothetical protein